MDKLGDANIKKFCSSKDPTSIVKNNGEELFEMQVFHKELLCRYIVNSYQSGKKNNKPQIKEEIDNGYEKDIQEMGKPNNQYNIA